MDGKGRAARERGFDGLRLTGNTFWLERQDWGSFARYEATVNQVIVNYHMLAVCSYALSKCGPQEFIDVVRNHQLALIRQNGEWELIASSGLMEARQALEHSERRLQALVETAADAIVLTDRGGRMVLWNRGAETMFGYRAEEVLNRPLTLIMPERYREAHERAVQTASGGTSQFFKKSVESVGLRKDGTEFPLECSLSRWRSAGKTFFTGVIRDISERKQAEEQIRRHAADLEAANRELEAFTSSASHDLRNPLCAIDGFSQALEDHADNLDDEGMFYLKQIRDEARRMNELLDALLSLSRVTRAELRSERVDLSGIARDLATELSQRDPERRARFVIAETLTAEGDARLLSLALENLLANAWKFTRTRRRCRIEFGRLRPTDGGPAFYVRDNGVGFDMSHAVNLFNPFQRLHPQEEFEGTGIGLATVQRIIHRHGGRIWAEGAVGQGATFYFTLA